VRLGPWVKRFGDRLIEPGRALELRRELARRRPGRLEHRSTQLDRRRNHRGGLLAERGPLGGREPDTNVRLPAKFKIRTGGALDPPVIAAPRHTDVALAVVSGDRQVHTFVLLTPHSYRMTVPPSAHVLLKGVPNGSYVVEVDHVRRGSLIIGAAPGP